MLIGKHCGVELHSFWSLQLEKGHCGVVGACLRVKAYTHRASL